MGRRRFVRGRGEIVDNGPFVNGPYGLARNLEFVCRQDEIADTTPPPTHVGPPPLARGGKEGLCEQRGYALFSAPSVEGAGAERLRESAAWWERCLKDLSHHREQVAVPLPPQREARELC